MTALKREEARELAAQAILSTTWKCPVQIQDDLTREYDFGWVFFYNSTEYIQSRRREVALFGNAPLIVSRDGRVTLTGTAHHIDDYVAAYGALGPDRFPQSAEAFIVDLKSRRA